MQTTTNKVHELCEGTGIVVHENGDKDFCSCPKGRMLELANDQ